MEIIIALTGASGIIYGVNLLKNIHSNNDCTVHLIISENAKQLSNFETDLKLDDITAYSNFYYENSELTAAIASGSNLFDALVIVPCSMSTAAKINIGVTDNLITRVADVCFKEHRKLILVPRETPLNSTHLKNLLELSEKGAIVLPAMPAYYHQPRNIDDIIQFITGKILDNLGIEHNLYTRWSGVI